MFDSRLSLIEEGEDKMAGEEEEPVIEDFKSDESASDESASDTGYTLV